MAKVKRYRGRWVVDYIDTNRKRHINVVKPNTRDAAELKLAEVVRKGKRPVNLRTRFESYGNWWLENCAKGLVKDSTYSEYEAAFKKHLSPAFDSLPFAKVTKKAIREFVRAKRDDGLAESTLRNILAPMRAMYRQAVQDEEIGADPFDGLRKLTKKSKDGGENVNPLTRDELARVLQAAREHLPHYYPALLCAARTGIRIGELVALHWGDVDFNRRFLNIRWAYSRGKYEKPKSGKPRKVDMSKQLRDVLKERWAERRRMAFEKGIRNIADEFVFLTPRDTPLERNNFRRNVFNKVLDLAEVRHVRLHDLRHTYATLLIENGESLAYIKEQLGHYSIQITVDLYGHLTPGTNKQAVDRLDDEPKVETNSTKIETSGNGRTA